MRVEPGELAVAQPRGQLDFAACFLGNLHAEVNGVGRARRNQANVHYRARRPGIALVNRIAVRIHLQGTIEVRSLFDRAFAVVIDLAAPENRLALVVDSFEFEPGIVGINRAAGEEVADALSAYHHVYAHGITAPHRRLDTIERVQ